MTYDPFDPFNALVAETPPEALAEGQKWVVQQFYKDNNMKNLPHNKYVYSFVLEWDDSKEGFTLSTWVSDEQAMRIAQIINEDNEKKWGQKVAHAGLCMRQRTYYNDDGTTRQENSYEPVRDEYDD